MNTNVLNKLNINPLALFHLWEEIDEYNNTRNDEQLAAFFHKLLTRFGHRPLVLSFIYAMIGHATDLQVENLISETEESL